MSFTIPSGSSLIGNINLITATPMGPINIIKEESDDTSYELNISQYAHENGPYGYQIKINRLDFFKEFLGGYEKVNFLSYINRIKIEVRKTGVLKITAGTDDHITRYSVDLRKPFYIASYKKPPSTPVMIREIINIAKNQLAHISLIDGYTPCFYRNIKKIKGIFYTSRKTFFLVTNEKESKIRIFFASIIDGTLKQCHILSSKSLIEHHTTWCIKIPQDDRKHLLTLPSIHVQKELFSSLIMQYDDTSLRQAT
jgi:hypothetical protein